MATWACPNCRDIMPLFEALIHWSVNHGVDGNFVCPFCGVLSPNRHSDNCLHKLALEYIKEHKNGGGNQKPNRVEDRQVGDRKIEGGK